MKSYLTLLAVSIVSALAPAKSMIITVFILIVMDLITGLFAARRKREKINSAGVRRTVTKLLVYEIAVILAFLTQTYLTGETIPVSNIVASLVGLTELISIIENLNAISGQKLLKSILDKLDSVNK